MPRTAFALAALALAFTLAPAHPVRAQAQSAAEQADMEGVWAGYDGEWHHTTYQLLALAEATPADKFAFRPEPSVRSTSEVYMHIVTANFWYLSIIGQPMPPELKADAEKRFTSKPEVIAWLKRSLEAVRAAHLKEKPDHLAKHVTIDGLTTTIDSIYLRTIIHSNEHMGQLIAYARMAGIVPPWSGK
ncbi:MAG TPA: DinB family protein [Terracidiphilus sp.]|jgi:uncharacterized damage-inducible protein DinB|nr:DinB family protein [Terracidiphilus sp.]